MHAKARLLLAAVALVVCGACKVDISVAVRADDDGTGEVRATAILDRKAVDAIGDLETQLALDDLGETGWTVEGPVNQASGGAEIVVRHDFADADEAQRLVEDLGGQGGPLKGFRLTQRRTFLKTTTEFGGVVDLSGGVGSFSDARLTEALGGQALGVTDAQLEDRLGEPLERVFGLQVAVRLPGSVDSNAPTKTGNGGVWAPKLGEQATIQATAERWNVVNIAAVTIAIVAAAGLVGLAVSRRRTAPS